MKSLGYPEQERRASRISEASDFIPDVKIGTSLTEGRPQGRSET
jgi:hypothetical protein